VRRFLRTSFVLLRNLCAVLGVVLASAVLATYLKGRDVLAEFEPSAVGALSAFAERVLSKDVTSALALRAALPGNVAADEALAAMKQRADERGLAVAHRKLDTIARDELPDGAIFELEYLDLCNPQMKLEFLAFNKDFGAHTPCRITLFQDAKGRIWLMALDLDPLVHVHRTGDPVRKARLVAFKDALLDVFNAGVLSGRPQNPLDPSLGE